MEDLTIMTEKNNESKLLRLKGEILFWDFVHLLLIILWFHLKATEDASF